MKNLLSFNLFEGKAEKAAKKSLWKQSKRG